MSAKLEMNEMKLNEWKSLLWLFSITIRTADDGALTVDRYLFDDRWRTTDRCFNSGKKVERSLKTDRNFSSIVSFHVISTLCTLQIQNSSIKMHICSSRKRSKHTTATATHWPYSLVHLQSPERLDFISGTWISATLSIWEIPDRWCYAPATLVCTAYATLSHSSPWQTWCSAAYA